MSHDTALPADETLAACPWCNVAPVVGDWATYYVRCPECRAEQIGLTRAEAITAWNTRPPSSGRDEALAEIDRLIDVYRSSGVDECLRDVPAMRYVRERIAALPARPYSGRDEVMEEIDPKDLYV
jgi:hypothetical protein